MHQIINNTATLLLKAKGKSHHWAKTTKRTVSFRVRAVRHFVESLGSLCKCTLYIVFSLHNIFGGSTSCSLYHHEALQPPLHRYCNHIFQWRNTAFADHTSRGSHLYNSTSCPWSWHVLRPGWCWHWQLDISLWTCQRKLQVRPDPHAPPMFSSI